MSQNIPLYKASVSELERKAVLRVLDSGKLSRGEEVASFEKELAIFLNKKYVIATNSGTSALDIAIKAVGFKGKVYTSPFSYIATGNSLLENNTIPVFSDIDKDTLNLDFSADTGGIDYALIVHNLGNVNDYEKFLNLGINRSKVIEDCSQSFTPAKEGKLGQFGETLVFSFHESKLITTGGEGGSIATDNEEIAKICRSLRDQGRIEDKDWMEKIKKGYSARMTELSAAFGRAQLAREAELREKRQKLWDYYKDKLKNIEGMELAPKENCLFSFYLLLKDRVQKERVSKVFKDRGISLGTNFYPPLHLLPEFGFLGYKKGDFPITESAYDRLIALPFYSDMDQHEADEITDTLIKAMEVIHA